MVRCLDFELSLTKRLFWLDKVIRGVSEYKLTRQILQIIENSTFFVHFMGSCGCVCPAVKTGPRQVNMFPSAGQKLKSLGGLCADGVATWRPYLLGGTPGKRAELGAMLFCLLHGHRGKSVRREWRTVQAQ